MRFLVFTGLGHHVKRLKLLLGDLEERGHELIYLTSQNPYCDHRTDFEAPLRAAGLPHHTLARYRSHPEWGHELDARRRGMNGALAAAFARGATPPWFTLGITPDFAIGEVVEDATAMELAFRELRPDAAIVLHEANFWTRTLSATAAAHAVPLFSFQEGLFYEFFSDHALKGWGAYSTAVYLWGDRDRRRLLGAGVTPEKLHVMGPQHLDLVLEQWTSREEAKRRLELPEDRPIVVLAAPNGAVSPLAPEFLECLRGLHLRHPELQLVVKWRQVETGGQRERVDHYLSHELGDRYHSISDADPYLVVAAGDVVLGQATTLGCEAVVLGCPYLEVAWRGLDTSGVTNLHEEAGIELLREPEDLSKILDYARDGIPAAVAERTQHFRDDSFGGLHPGSARRTVDHILETTIAAKAGCAESAG